MNININIKERLRVQAQKRWTDAARSKLKSFKQAHAPTLADISAEAGLGLQSEPARGGTRSTITVVQGRARLLRVARDQHGTRAQQKRRAIVSHVQTTRNKLRFS